MGINSIGQLISGVEITRLWQVGIPGCPTLAKFIPQVHQKDGNQTVTVGIPFLAKYIPADLVDAPGRISRGADFKGGQQAIHIGLGNGNPPLAIGHVEVGMVSRRP